MRAYWWLGPGESRNWGDQLNSFILSKMSQDHEWAPVKEAELVVCGSVLEHLPYSWAGTICGAGKLHEHRRINLSEARVFALRGLLTLAGVHGLRQEPVLGDPGLLVPLWIPQPVAKHSLGVLPHWSDTELVKRFPQGHVIDPLAPPSEVIKEIASCKQLISSSLHGIIVADAYGIPRQAELFPQAHTEGGDFKFRDYASVYGEDPHFGHMHRVPRQIVERIRSDLYVALQQAVGIDLPTDVENRMHPQMSLIVPFRDDGEHRSRVWRWLRKYWRARNMNAEIIQGWDYGTPFSKAQAVNNAAALARGRTLVILDADAYMDPAILSSCADNLDEAACLNHKTWYMPYNRLYRLSEDYTKGMLERDPTGPPMTGEPQQRDLDVYGSPYEGHIYGAMAQVVPAEAFRLVEGMDPRFRGWGAEDISLLRALDTLWGHHEVADGQVIHFWHAKIGSGFNDRKWVGQDWAYANGRLAQRYAAAVGEPGYMSYLCQEHPLD